MSVVRLSTGAPDTSNYLPNDDEEFLGLKDPRTIKSVVSDEREIATQHVRAWQAGTLYVSAVILWFLPLLGCGISSHFGANDCVVQPGTSVSISSTIRKGSFATAFAYFGGVFFFSIFIILTQFERSFFVTLTTLVALLSASVPLLVPVSSSATGEGSVSDTAHIACAFIGGALILVPLFYILFRLYTVARRTQPQAAKIFWLLLVWVIAYIVIGLFLVAVSIGNRNGTNSQDVQSYGIIIGEILGLAALVCAVRVVIRARKIFEIK